nr:uncharacterized protein LOC104093083 [Nicotiana tomentosiformis]XP_009597093.1 uncharacterized protein LOC104093083 [Nicotiana tomentosiformis]
MAGGRGGRTKKVPIVTFGSSVGAHMQPESTNLETELITPTHLSKVRNPNEAWRSSTPIGAAKKLQLSSDFTIEKRNGAVESSIEHDSTTIEAVVQEPNETVLKQGTDPIASIQEKPTQPWVNLFSKNKTMENGMALSYIAPQIVNGKIVIQLEKEEVERETGEWRGSLIAYVIVNCSGYNAMRRYIDQKWNNITSPDLFMHDEVYYIIKFQTIADMHEILYFRPYTINNRPIILKP